MRELVLKLRVRVNDFLGRAVARVREVFGGKVTYASIAFEGVDWTPFDFVSVDCYRMSEIANQFRAGIRVLVAQEKPVAITEFGCITFHGAADKGAHGELIVEWGGAKAVRLNGDYTRDENKQATEIRELLEIFNAEAVDSVFLNTIARYDLPHRSNPQSNVGAASTFGLSTGRNTRWRRTSSVSAPEVLGGSALWRFANSRWASKRLSDFPARNRCVGSMNAFSKSWPLRVNP